ncbi:hypothetical protein DFH28DRAFT_204475 [Melampsora americana]|nr:hypothetical protein DFH28DRAFT_204475 [Melampsora americana]
MRRSFQDIKLGTGQVSVALESLRSRLVGIKAGRRQMQPPFLDTINRSVHQLTQALSHHILHIHHLSSRLRALQVAQSKTNQSSLDLVPAHNLGSSLHEHDQTFTESAALQALQNEHTGVRLRDAILGQRRRPILTVPQASDFSEESALSLILPAEPIIIKPRKASSPPKSTLSYECRSPTWFHSPRLSHGRLSEGQSISSPPLAPDSAKAGQWFGSERNSGKAGGWMRGSR